jgi:hypothetical protein
MPKKRPTKKAAPGPKRVPLKGGVPGKKSKKHK